MIMGKAVVACFRQGWAGKGVGIKEHFVRGCRSELCAEQFKDLTSKGITFFSEKIND